MQMAYGDKNLFHTFFLFVVDKLDVPVEITQEKEVWWFFSFGKEWNIFILSFLDTLWYTLFKKYVVFSYFGSFGDLIALIWNLYK